MNSNLPEVFAAVDEDGTGHLNHPLMKRVDFTLIILVHVSNASLQSQALLIPGQIEYPEFLAGFGLDNTPLCQKIFYLFDEVSFWSCRSLPLTLTLPLWRFAQDHSGALDYYEFLKAIDKYRKMTYDERLAWCFKVR